MPKARSKATREPLKVRRAGEGDLPSILRLYAQSGMSSGRAGDATTLNVARRILKRMARYPDYAVYVATAGKTGLVGTFAFLVMDNLAHAGARSAIVEAVCVDEGWRRRGVGRAMMTFALALARKRRCYKLSLSSNIARRHAHAFYRSLGFRQHGLSFQVQGIN